MVYRIRCSDPAGQHEREVLVEAHNTTEAMVKFCHAQGRPPDNGLAQGRLSICPEADEDSAPDLGSPS